MLHHRLVLLNVRANVIRRLILRVLAASILGGEVPNQWYASAMTIKCPHCSTALHEEELAFQLSSKALAKEMKRRVEAADCQKHGETGDSEDSATITAALATIIATM
jgi:hypothetical protein